MFGGLKKMLGIEDVKLDVIIPEKVSEKSGKIDGLVRITSFKDSAIESVTIKLIERYTRGRKESRLIDEYIVGFIDLEEKIDVRKEDIIELPFSLPFKLTKSEMDKMEDKYFLLGGIVKLAKVVKGVKSEYKVQAEAFVRGTKLHPLDTKTIVIS